jgi:hypothetical protein
VLAVLAGCKLVDQRTFQPAARAPSASTLARAAQAARPVLVVAMTMQASDWRAAVNSAVSRAEAHDPKASFAVNAPIPVNASAADQDRFAATGASDAALVARQIQENGVPVDRIAIGYESDAGTPPREIRLYVR